MTYECALLCMHGMGNLTRHEFESDIAKLRQNLTKRLPTTRLPKLYIPPAGIFYSNLTQQREDDVWGSMLTQGGLNTGWIRRNTVNLIRRFIISGFSDATAIAGFNRSDTEQQYTNAQQLIYKALENVYKDCGDVPVVIISDSLGCQIMSCYLWDAQLYWRNSNLGGKFAIDSRSIWKNHQPTDLDGFLCLQSLKVWFTTGCNIPIFVSGFKNVRAVDNRRHGYNFDWLNYFDFDDVLGYPLAPLSVLFDPADTQGHGQSYADAATDIPVDANDGIWGTITSSWNPLSHTQYWRDDTILDALASALK